MYDKETDGFVCGEKIDGKNLVVGEYYQITFPNEHSVVVKLNRSLPNSFGDDYIFENINGAEDLVNKTKSSIINDNEFPLPEQLLSITQFNELKRI